MDQQKFEAMFGKPDPTSDAQPQANLTPTAQPAPQAHPEATPSQQATSLLGRIYNEVTGEHPEPVEGQDYGTAPEAGTAQALGDIYGQSISDATEVPRAAAGGAMKSVFETKDFLFGDTKDGEKSAFRSGIEGEVKDLTEKAPILNGFSAGIGQFATSMVGLGKLGMAAKLIPWVGRAVEGLETYRVGAAALEAAKAATAGAIAFDPHEERLSNLVQDTPLANPVTEWLASNKDDSAALGRLKTAMESIGMDAMLIGTFVGAGKVYKALRAGDTAGASHAVNHLEREQQRILNPEPVDTIGPQSPEARPEVEGDGGKPTDSPAQTSEVPTGQQSDASPSPADAQTAKRDSHAAAAPSANLSATATNPEGAAAKETYKPNVMFSDEDTAAVLKGAEDDAAAIEKYGDFYRAMAAGHPFGKGDGIPYARFKTDADVDDFMARAADAKAEEMGSVRISDADLQKQVGGLATLMGEDPAALFGMIQTAGENATHQAAQMLAAGSLSAKMFRDTHALALRFKMGDFTEFGSAQAMQEEIKRRLSLASSAYNSMKSMRANAGRSLRALRGAPFDPDILRDVPVDRLVDLLDASKGDPRNFKHLANPGLWSQLGDFVNYLRVNNLVSGPKTQLVNLTTNAYMVGVRPLERMIGALPGAAMGDKASRVLLRENVKQYIYMGTSLTDSWGAAFKAFTRNDSVISPHGSEMFQSAPVPGSQAIGQYFKPWDNIGNVLHNAVSAAMFPVGLPTRTLGGVDELVKQVVYRSKLQARAHMEAVEMLADRGLTGKDAKDFVSSYVQTKLASGFDDLGRGTDAEALREANIATFQQDLLKGTFGRTVQDATANSHLIKLVLPFVKTPTNVIRYGWKMTPGLNMLQGEYRQMLSGAMGKEAKAQAIGQMSMGALFMGAASYLVSQGHVTGGGPKDPKRAAELKATGWQPYSIVTTNTDGSKKFTPYGKYDPIAIPFGIIADLQDAMEIFGDNADENPTIAEGISALGIGLAKQFTSKTYLTGLNGAIEALQDPERQGTAFAGDMATSFIPLSAAMRQTNPDDFMREARTITDKVMANIPGLSESLSPRFNWLGQPVLARRGLWSDDNGSVVDHEVQRLVIEGGSMLSPPSPNFNNVDLRDITLSDGSNAYETYQRLVARPTPRARVLRDVIAKVMQSPRYLRAPDGDQSTRGTKLWILFGYVNRYREAAGRVLRRDKVIRDAITKKQRKVIDQYRHLREPQGTPETQLGKVGKGFGVNTGK